MTSFYANDVRTGRAALPLMLLEIIKIRYKFLKIEFSEKTTITHMYRGSHAD